MPDNKPMVVYAATYGSVSAAEADLDAIEALHKDKVIGSFDAAVIDQENGKPHVVKRMDRPGVRVIPEGLARQVLAAIEAPGARPRPRRAALARLDLALALTAADKHDEAAGVTLEAIRSGRLAPVDDRRAREIVLAVAERGVPEAAELAEAYQAACGDGSRPGYRDDVISCSPSCAAK